VNEEHRELFIYYRVAASNWRDAIHGVRAFQQRLCAIHAGLSARVLRRPDEHNGEVTLMETYACVGPGPCVVDESLEARIEAAAQALQPWLLGERHVERFEALD
jgi:Domain of unknown function (DUF4936)